MLPPRHEATLTDGQTDKTAIGDVSLSQRGPRCVARWGGGGLGG